MERKLLLLWFKRFNTVNKGILRIVLILSILLFLVSFIILIPVFNDPSDPIIINLFKPLMISIISYFLTITLFRLGLWIYDGFHN